MKIFLNDTYSNNKIVLLLLVLILSGCSAAKSPAHYNFTDRILTNAKVYTINPVKPRAEAVAIKDGRIVYVGNNSGIKK